jgi:hypothetical protein
MSDLLSRIDNPRGYLISAIATVVCGLLLLPVATLFQRTCRSLHCRWAVMGAWVYRGGLAAAIATGISTPFQQPYVPIHIYLAFAAFMALVAGLTICLAATACFLTSARLRLAVLAALHAAALSFLTFVFLTPRYFDGRRWFLAVCEWGLSVLIAVGTMALAAASVPHFLLRSPL